MKPVIDLSLAIRGSAEHLISKIETSLSRLFLVLFETLMTHGYLRRGWKKRSYRDIILIILIFKYYKLYDSSICLGTAI